MTTSSEAPLALFVSVPVASFRKPYAREFLETYTCVPPSTVYGALLSVVGDVDRSRHQGARLALAMLELPVRSVVLRTTWRIKKSKQPPGTGSNVKPDYQELLTGVKLALWLEPGPTETAPTLSERVSQALSAPDSVRRFGGLSLGESTHLVDELRELRDGDAAEGEFMVPDVLGPLVLPLWPDHVGSAGTHWLQARMERRPVGGLPMDDCWMTIEPRAEDRGR